MLIELEAFTLADPVFFDSERSWGGDAGRFAQTHGPVPPGWQREEQEVWVHLVPDGHRMPQQGWKIHVSACLDNAGRVLDTVYDYCVAHQVAFKFLRSHQVLRAHSLKYAERSSSGKLVTIYPTGVTQLRTVLSELSQALDGEPGPYILTDLRWGSGPLYVRYGAFVMMYCPGESGEPVPALARPDGALVPDRRLPVFTVPEWVDVPDFFAPHLAARQAGASADNFPYRPESALHFSNGGGVYLARHTGDNRQVVLKEARPHAGLDVAGRDAIARLRAERDALRRLDGIPGVPKLYEYRRVWEHEFLVQQYLPGDSLFRWLAEHHPLVRADPTAEQVQAFTERAVRVADQIDRIVSAIHERGLVMGDLHPNNVLVDDDDTVSLIDFEVAADAGAPAQKMGFPGFKVTYKTGPAGDRHSVAAIRLWLFAPIVELTALAPDKIEQLLAGIADRFPLPAGYVAGIRAELSAGHERRPPGAVGASADVDLTGPAPDWAAARKSLAQAILLSATPEREDRLFPGDIQQFVGEGMRIGFGYGAAGVLWALDVAGAGRYPPHEQWLVAAARRVTPVRAGFYDGLFGLAYVLDHFGHREAAAPVLADAVRLTAQLESVNLHSGLAGAGLALLHFARRHRESGYAKLAGEVAQRLAGAVRDGAPHGIDQVPGRDGRPVAQLGSRAGLLRGWTGPALFFLRLHQRTGDPAHLDLAVEALHRDLDLCRPAPDGSLQVDAGFGLLPYLELGSAGIALVTAEVLPHRADQRLAEALPLLVRACRPELVFECQLFQGRAGLMATLARLARQRPELAPELAPAVHRHLDRLGWHALSYRGELSFPGTKLRRLSMDLATGNAGMLLAIGAAVGEPTELLPFLGHR